MERRFILLSGQADVKKVGERLRFINSSGSVEKPVRYIEAVIVLGSLSLSSHAVSLLLSNRIPVFFLSRFGTFRGMLMHGFLSSANTLRIRQYEAFLSRRLEIARGIILRKLENIERIYMNNMSDLKLELRSADSIDAIMGIEGRASRLMFKSFKKNIAGSGLRFAGRSYRPPADEINALLSFAYSLTYALAFPLILHLGYDPYLSFLHTKRGSHASFCSDIIEPLRPFVTKELEKEILRNGFRRKDFVKEGKGFYLRRESLPKFMGWFEKIKDSVVGGLKESILSVGEDLA